MSKNKIKKNNFIKNIWKKKLGQQVLSINPRPRLCDKDKLKKSEINHKDQSPIIQCWIMKLKNNWFFLKDLKKQKLKLG
jgi:hypothetical protein